MDPFATPIDLATFLQTATQSEVDAGSGDGLDTAVATQALVSASAAIRAVCGWPITEATVTGETVEVCGGRIFINTLRLTALALSAGGVPLLEGTDFTIRTNGVVTLAAFRSWYSPPVLATYTHGFTVPPDEVVAVCLEEAAQRVNNPEQLVQTTIDGVSMMRRGQISRGDLAEEPRLTPYRLVPAIA